MTPRGRRVWRTVMTLSAIVAGTIVVPGVAQAAPPEGAAVVREAAVFANLDSLSPPVVTTLEPGRDVAYPACRRDETDMVFIRWAPPRTLPRPQDVGWTYVDALDLHAAPPPC